MIFVQASSLCFLGGIQRGNSTFISKYRNSDKMPHCCCHRYGSISRETNTEIVTKRPIAVVINTVLYQEKQLSSVWILTQNILNVLNKSKIVDFGGRYGALII